ncbi:hypothetical protein KFL_008340040 [Klebsormidium nitens]|uniref:Uncharacterized protein n=1 Tax=Klebsormidium nitens TaxID=105231 RepID=A0A1Y1ILL3_KLENI|nr:hypothetical protein KFL_008340040 [Klebsormidium nitens]|eukprot:GAQ91684.1 hypothetical protein KFL_008340040 [Klebsormidium nitens]
MASMQEGMHAGVSNGTSVPSLIDLCIEAILSGGLWKYQRRSLERLPSPFVERLFHRLLSSRQLSPPLLELFQACLEEVDLSGVSAVDATWLAYVGAYTHLRSLNLAACKNVTDASLWHLLGLSSLETLSLARCSRVTFVGLRHILPMTSLRSLDISETAVSPAGVNQLGVRTALTELRVGGIAIDGTTLQRLQPLSHLRLLHAWGSALTDSAAALLPTLFPCLESLSLAWTDVTRLPTLPALTSLDMSQCTVETLFERSSAVPSPLKELTLFGATVNAAAEWPALPHLARLDLAGGRARPDFFFCGRYAASLTSLDLSNTIAEDGGGGLWGLVAAAQSGGAVLPLRRLKLVGGKSLDEEELSLRGDLLLSGKMANLEELAVTGWDAGDRDWARLPAVLPRLTSLDLRAAPEHDLPMAAIGALAVLPSLVSLSISGVPSDDCGTEIAKHAQGLRSLALRGDSISDSALEPISSMPRVRSLAISGGVLTDAGVAPLAKMDALQRLDLRGCWLLTSSGLKELRKRFKDRRGPSGLSVKIEHESLPFAPDKGDAANDGPASKGNRKSGGSSNVWFGVGPGGSRSPGQFRKAGKGKGEQRQSADKGRAETSSRRDSRGSSVDERVRYKRDDLVGLQGRRLGEGWKALGVRTRRHEKELALPVPGAPFLPYGLTALASI